MPAVPGQSVSVPKTVVRESDTAVPLPLLQTFRILFAMEADLE